MRSQSQPRITHHHSHLTQNQVLFVKTRISHDTDHLSTSDTGRALPGLAPALFLRSGYDHPLPLIDNLDEKDTGLDEQERGRIEDPAGKDAPRLVLANFASEKVGLMFVDGNESFLLILQVPFDVDRLPAQYTGPKYFSARRKLLD